MKLSILATEWYGPTGSSEQLLQQQGLWFPVSKSLYVLLRPVSSYLIKTGFQQLENAGR